MSQNKEQELLAPIRAMINETDSLKDICNNIIKIMSLEQSAKYEKILEQDSYVTKVYDAAIRYFDKDCANQKSKILYELFEALEATE